jgi:serine/threonine protein kinase
MRAARGNIFLSKNKLKNTLRYKNVDYFIRPLSEDFPKSKGGNSNVFVLLDPQEQEEYVIKLSKYNLNNKKLLSKNWDRVERFDREIKALQIAKENNFEFVVKILFDGIYEVNTQSFRYFIMEKGTNDLTDYLKGTELTIQQRFLICTQILSGIKELHSKGIYHRDIKPDNILLVDGTWKISDLGLIDSRDSDMKAQEVGMKIGPANWMSPEAFNKMYNEGKGCSNIFDFDCNIDEKSDIYQLGKLFWFIFQGNIPDGQLIRDDFKIKDDLIYKVLIQMLNHSKNRPSMDEIESDFENRYSEYFI